ncbi:hypothetical protein OVY29_03700 [Sphingopyxis sp. SE2]|uniref:hypothetical protein n=1 Tax=Sphingopyxis sp. SE2 TaxID=1586240 RepID=UPI0028C2F14D|nr:hypothetical protein [Sphingopyxis sp. SE2]MDT7527768.1 hypothetical protein [Sphingopyxis sp. SE2]
MTAINSDFVANARVVSAGDLAQIVDAASPVLPEDRTGLNLAGVKIGRSVLLALMGATITAISASAA